MSKILPVPMTPLIRRAGLAVSASLAIACGDSTPALSDTSDTSSDTSVPADVTPDADPFDGMIPPQPPPRDIEDDDLQIPPQLPPDDVLSSDADFDDVLPPPADVLEDGADADAGPEDVKDPFDGAIPPQPAPQEDTFEPEPEPG